MFFLLGCRNHPIRDRSFFMGGGGGHLKIFELKAEGGIPKVEGGRGVYR